MLKQLNIDFDNCSTCGVHIDKTMTMEKVQSEYFNTTHVHGEELKQYKSKAKKQSEKILEWFKANPNELRSPSDIHALLFDSKTPLTSTRRSITDLTGQGYLEMTEHKKMSPFNRPEHFWKLRKMI